MTSFIVYSKTLANGKPCPYCEKAKRLLTRLGYSFEVRDLSNPLYREYFDSWGFATVPQIFRLDGHTVDSNYSTTENVTLIGGYDDLVDWLED